MAFDLLSAIGQHLSIYQKKLDPSLIARLATNENNIIGDSSWYNADFPVLAIYETDPQESLLDIFWETGTVGLVV